MSLGSISHGVWIGCIALQVLLALVLVTKKVWRQYPIFAVYVFFALLQAPVAYTLFQHRVLYFYTFWICEAIGIVLGLMVVREIFAVLFTPHPALRKLATMIFQVAVVALVVLAGVAIYVESWNARGIANATMMASEAAHIMEVGLIVFLFLCSSAFGLHWRQNVFGIALGLGLCGAIELVNVTLMAHQTPATALVFNLIRQAAYGVSLLIWLGYFLAPEPVSVNVGEIPKHAQLEQWNQAVMELISQ
jgi:hypothetical protein